MGSFEYKNISVNIQKVDNGEYLVSLKKPYRREYEGES